MDTEVLEVDESTVKQLGLQFPVAAVSSTFTEVAPLYPIGNSVPGAGQQIPYLNFFPLIRSPVLVELSRRPNRRETYAQV